MRKGSESKPFIRSGSPKNISYVVRTRKKEIATYTTKNPALPILNSRFGQVRISPRNDSPIVQRHVAANRRMDDVASLVVRPDDSRSGPSEGSMRRRVVRMAWRWSQKGCPVGIVDVLSGGEPYSWALDGGDGAPVIVLELHVPGGNSSVGESVVQLCVELCGRQDVRGQRVSNHGSCKPVPDSVQKPTGQLSFTLRLLLM